MNYFKIPIKWIILATLFLLVISPLGISQTGFCPSEMRFISDEEKIRNVVKLVTFKRTSVDKFIADNPGCCRIGPERGEYDEPTLFRRYRGVISDIVVIEYDRNYLDSSVAVNSIRKNQYAVNWCGKISRNFL